MKQNMTISSRTIVILVFALLVILNGAFFSNVIATTTDDEVVIVSEAGQVDAFAGESDPVPSDAANYFAIQVHADDVKDVRLTDENGTDITSSSRYYITADDSDGGTVSYAVDIPSGNFRIMNAYVNTDEGYINIKFKSDEDKIEWETENAD